MRTSRLLLLVLLVMVVLAGTALAQLTPKSYKFTWKPSASASTTVAGYRLYMSTNLGSGYTLLMSITATAASVQTPVLNPSPLYFYMTTLGINGKESPPSNVVTYGGPPSQVKPPTLSILP